MFTVPVAVADSPIDGKGVFSVHDIRKGTVVWKYREGHDNKLNRAEAEALPSVIRAYLERTGYLSPWSGMFIFPPPDDPALYLNHSRTPALIARFNKKVSPEPYFVASRHIKAGEELTNNYVEFDGIIRSTLPEWV
jgi:SET domain-containing protein